MAQMAHMHALKTTDSLNAAASSLVVVVLSNAYILGITYAVVVAVVVVTPV